MSMIHIQISQIYTVFKYIRLPGSQIESTVTYKRRQLFPVNECPDTTVQSTDSEASSHDWLHL
jgi:hypothetical protein